MEINAVTDRVNRYTMPANGFLFLKNYKPKVQTKFEVKLFFAKYKNVLYYFRVKKR